MPAHQSFEFVHIVGDGLRYSGYPDSVLHEFLQPDPVTGDLVPRPDLGLPMDPHLYGVTYPLDDAMRIRRPDDDIAAGIDIAKGNPHYLPGGNTAVLLSGDAGRLVNTMIDEFVHDSGWLVPKGTIFWTLGPDGARIVLRRF